MPIVLKDNIDVADVPTTVGSRLFAGRLATEDAEVTRRLSAAVP
jgi:Asp-tRNA(Asn)/Glu-tRNA(Gln) amidotransferase A subunit family amidase